MMKGHEYQNKGSRTSKKSIADISPLSSRGTDNENQGSLFRKFQSQQYSKGAFANKLVHKNVHNDFKEDNYQMKGKSTSQLQIICVDPEELNTDRPIKHRTVKCLANEESDSYYYQKPEKEKLMFRGSDAFQQRSETETGILQLKNQFDKLKRYMDQSIGKNFKELTKEIKEVEGNCFENFKRITQDFNKHITKLMRSDKLLEQELEKVQGNLSKFQRSSQDDINKLHMEISGMYGGKKSKANGEYGVDIKNSINGLNLATSMSMNLGNETMNTKLLNQIMLQIDTLKSELDEKHKVIEEMDCRMNTISKSILKSHQRDQKCNENLPSTPSLKQEEIVNLIHQKIKEDRRKSNIEEKMQMIEANLKRINEVAMCHQQNIKGMNDQFANVLNNCYSPRIKRIEASIVEFEAKLDRNHVQKMVSECFNREMKEKVSQHTIVQVRNAGMKQKEKLSVLSGRNQEKISFKETYFLDEQSYLMDSSGVYLMEQIKGEKKKIKIEEELIYLMHMKGIHIHQAINQ